jgi:hypothetical protein
MVAPLNPEKMAMSDRYVKVVYKQGTIRIFLQKNQFRVTTAAIPVQAAHDANTTATSH